jgi:4-hydroxy-3-methylbut-2-enyl diphosphate reductase
LKTFDIPTYYRSPIIGKVKAVRKKLDKLKKDFSPSVLKFDSVTITLARHFGFCYGVENAIEISYRAIAENPGKRIFLLSQMIHNPGVNRDLEEHGLQFLQDTHGNQLIEWDVLTPDDVVIIPAFGTTLEIEKKLEDIGVSTAAYNTTCPFVEKVWKRSAKLGSDDYTVVIHGKHQHEETRATFSHAQSNAKSIVIRDMEEAQILADFILGKRPNEEFYERFKGCFSAGFDLEKDFDRIGVVNQTTMLASETQAISDYLATIMEEKFGSEDKKAHFANTRDTLCYATNDNQSATAALMDEPADLALVIGGYNSSNTSHLVELLEEKFDTYYIKDESEINEDCSIHHFDMHQKEMKHAASFLPKKENLNIIITSGASCPDVTVDRVIQRVADLLDQELDIEGTIASFEKRMHEGI